MAPVSIFELYRFYSAEYTIIRSSSEPFGLISLEKVWLGLLWLGTSSGLVIPTVCFDRLTLYRRYIPYCIQSSRAIQTTNCNTCQNSLWFAYFGSKLISECNPILIFNCTCTGGYHLAIISHVRFFSGIIQLSLNE